MSACPLVLASASPRRRDLLSSVGIRFAVVPGNVAEDEIPGETPEEHVVRLSVEKARDVAHNCRVEGRSAARARASSSKRCSPRGRLGPGKLDLSASPTRFRYRRPALLVLLSSLNVRPSAERTKPARS